MMLTNTLRVARLSRSHPPSYVLFLGLLNIRAADPLAQQRPIPPLSPTDATRRQTTSRAFHTTRSLRFAQPPSADAIMERLNDLYATAKDEFEIAAEETEKKTVYAADDREAAQDAFTELKEVYEQAVRESDPETAKEVQGRVGPRIRELDNAITALEESALED